MGKRKDRRLAALSGASRRVKLDLSTDDIAVRGEPTGAMASTSFHDEAGGAVDQNHGDGAPSSPSSSGPHQEDPLLLLGQYSDDELDEGSKEAENEAVQESKPSVCADGQVAIFLGDLQTNGLLEKQLDRVKGVSEESVITEHSNLGIENSVRVNTDEDAKMETVTNAVEQSSVVTKDSNASILPDFTAAQAPNIEENEWKAVLHEESGRHYYWNIRTGETTWDAPSNATQEVRESAEERNQSKVESLENAHLKLSEVCPQTHIGQEAERVIPGIQENQTCTSIVADVPDPSPSRNQNEEQKEIQGFGPGFQLDKEFKERNQETQLILVTEEKLELNDMSSTGEEFGFKESVPHNSASSEQVMEGDADNNEMKNSEEEYIGRLEPTKGKCPKNFEEDLQDTSPNPLELLKWSEKLSQRFKALEGTGGTLRASNLRLRYAVEAEIRLADCKALCSSGDSLEQFWSHTQAQLKRLESVLGVEEAAVSSGPEQCRILHSRQMSSTSFSSLRNQIASKSMSQESGRDEKVKMVASLQSEHYMCSHKDEECVSPPTVANHMPPQNDEQVLPSQNEECKSSPKHERFTNSSKQEYTLHDTSNDLEEGEIKQVGDSKISEVAGSVISSPYRFEENNLKREADPFVGLKATQSSEDGGQHEDMEVDMEVDDQNMPDTSVGPLSLCEEALQAGSFTLSLPSIVAAVSTGSGSLFPPSMGDEVWGEPPPLPEEDWAPPLPPDSESIPPPPPDEPPPSPLPSAVLCNGYEAPLSPPLPYTEQYNSVYVPVPGYDYYQSTTSEAPNPDYCVQANTAPTDGIEMSYYEQTAGAFPESSDLNNPVEGVIYYEASSNVISDSLGLNNPDCPPYYEQAGPSTFIENSGIHMDGKHVGGPIGSITAFTGSSFGSMGAGEVASTQISTCVASSSSVSTTGVVPPIGDGTTGATSISAPKNLSKVVRTKKRTVAVAPTLRSNKKVSVLVDKWKAAKEELHGSDEDESDTAYEAMEKKRQREIEEWRMQQIASGEAQDNANFQPLGGDWRERVKRRKAEATVDENKPQAASVVADVSGGASETKKPDLVELSKDLPEGWQAFWDESSGEVYYGNLTTSETTWDRPK